jgi:arylsulfatase
LQEVFAGFLDHADDHISRLMAALDELGIYDNTFVLVVSDNGASQEGLQNGTANTDRYRNFFPDTVEELLPLLDKLGSAETDPHYPFGWAMAGNSPLKRWKQDTHAGGNTDPLIISWPSQIKDVGQLRRQYHHVVDIFPTLLEISQLPAPTSVNGVQQMPLHGVSMAYTFANADAPTRKQSQYYEMLGSRAIWSEGWTAVTWHKAGTPWEDDNWELYHTDVDFSQFNNLAQQEPEKLRSLQALWDQEAQKYNVYPLDDRRYERVADPNRPTAGQSLPIYTYYPGTAIVNPNVMSQLLGREHTVIAYVTIADPSVAGVLACVGTEFGGWALFVKDGKLHYVHNYLKIQEFAVASSVPLQPGQQTLGFRFQPTAKSLKPDYFDGNITLLINDNPVAELKGARSAAQYSVTTGYGLQVGRNMGTPVSHTYQAPFNFTGDLNKIEVSVGPAFE